jgi:hypothetical protein
MSTISLRWALYPADLLTEIDGYKRTTDRRLMKNKKDSCTVADPISDKIAWERRKWYRYETEHFGIFR